jgi:hypothetical protein
MAKLKSRFGGKCIEKTQEILQKMVGKMTPPNIRTSRERFEIKEQFTMSVGSRKHWATSTNRSCSTHEAIIEKLAEENKQLKIEKDTVSELYMTANTFSGDPGSKGHLSNFFNRKDSKLSQKLHSSETDEHGASHPSDGNNRSQSPT